MNTTLKDVTAQARDRFNSFIEVIINDHPDVYLKHPVVLSKDNYSQIQGYYVEACVQLFWTHSAYDHITAYEYMISISKYNKATL